MHQKIEDMSQVTELIRMMSVEDEGACESAHALPFTCIKDNV